MMLDQNDPFDSSEHDNETWNMMMKIFLVDFQAFVLYFM